MPKEPDPRDVDKAIIKLRIHPQTPQCVVDKIKEMKEEAVARMELRKIEVQSLGVELRHSIATKLKEVADGTRKPYLPNGEVDGREGWQYLYENSANSKNEIASMALLVTGTDPSAGNNLQIAILDRTKSAPISATEADVEIMRQID